MAELLERDDQLAALEERLGQARSGWGSLTLVAGEAGIGKTSVVRAFCDRHRADAHILWGWCEDLAAPPLGPLHDLARAAGGELAAVMQGETGRLDRFAGFLAALVSPLRPVIAVVEDIHWADEATLDLLAYTARRVGDTHGCVVATYRDDELPPDHPLWRVLGDLVRQARVGTLTLAPLSVAAVAALAAGHGIDASHVHRVTGGNPYFVTEVLASGSNGVPETVRAAVLARAARLSPAARSALDTIAVIPDRVELDLVAALIEGPAAVDECEQAGLLIGRDGSLAFRHELARRVVAQALPATRVARLHAAVLAALRQRSDVDSARLAYHADLAGDAEAVVRHAPDAAAEAARLGAYTAAAEHCLRALRHGETLSPQRRAALLPAGRRAELRELYGTALVRSGRIDGAIDAYAQAEAEWRDAGDVQRAGAALAVRGQFLWAAGRAEAAREAADAAVALLRAHPPGPGLTSACTYGAYLRMLERDRPAAIELGTEAIRLAEAYGQTSLLSKALNAVGCALWTTDPDAASATMARSLAVARQSGDDQTIGLALGNWGSAAIEVRRYAEGERLLQEDLAWCSERDMDIGRGYSRAWLARSRFEQGDWRQADVIARELAAQPQQNVATLTIALTVLGQLGVRRGQAEADGLLSRAWALAQEAADPPRLFPVAAARAEAAWLAGAPQRIPELVEEAFALAGRLGEPWAVGELGLWLWRAGAVQEPPPGSAPPYAHQISGDWAAAALAWDAIGCPYEAALARADSDAPDQLLVAIEALYRLNARPAADLVAARLRGMGVRQLPRRRSSATVANPGGLTDRELDVLRLLVDGLPNTAIAARLHISRRTADHHVAAILAKLGVPSRHEAARHARDHGWFGPTTR